MFSCFRGYQLHNPFHTIWATKVGNNLAVSFCISVYSSSVLAVLQDRLFEILYRDQPPKMANFFPSVAEEKCAGTSRVCLLTSASTVYAFMGVWGERQRRYFFLTFSVRLYYRSGSLCISLLLVSLCHGVQSVLEHPG